MKRIVLLTTVAALIFVAIAASALAGPTVVPGQQDRYDQDQNGIPDAGIYVTGKYTSLYVYDANGDYYWDLGDGRIYGTVGSIAELDQATLTYCEYENVYRADFGNTPYMDDGWIINNIRQYGYDGHGHWTYLIVSDEDPRYTGNPDWAVWGSWEYHALCESGSGNLVKIGPKTP